MNNLLTTVLVAALFIAAALVLLGIGKLLTGKSRLRACGKKPNEPCDVCGSKPCEKDEDVRKK